MANAAVFTHEETTGGAYYDDPEVTRKENIGVLLQGDLDDAAFRQVCEDKALALNNEMLDMKGFLGSNLVRRFGGFIGYDIVELF
jgi:hypothetical protein